MLQSALNVRNRMLGVRVFAEEKANRLPQSHVRVLLGVPCALKFCSSKNFVGVVEFLAKFVLTRLELRNLHSKISKFPPPSVFQDSNLAMKVVGHNLTG